jgi:hypothetical protein
MHIQVDLACRCFAISSTDDGRISGRVPLGREGISGQARLHSERIFENDRSGQVTGASGESNISKQLDSLTQDINSFR